MKDWTRLIHFQSFIKNFSRLNTNMLSLKLEVTYSNDFIYDDVVRG